MSVPQILNICNGRNWTGTDNFQLGGRHNSMCQITLFHIGGYPSATAVPAMAHEILKNQI